MTVSPPTPWWRWLLPLVGVALLGVVLVRLDGTAMLLAVSALDKVAVAAAFAAFLSNVVIKGLRWHRMVRAQAIAIPVRASLIAFMEGVFYGAVTVGRIGEFVRARALVDRDVSWGRALSACVWDRLFDLAVLVLLAGTTAAYWTGDRRLVGVIVVGSAAAIVGGRWALARGVRWAESAGDVGTDSMGEGGFASTSRGHLRELLLASPALVRPAVLLETTAWTVAGWIGHVGAVLFLAHGLGLRLSWIPVVTATAVGALTSLLPITFQGVGTRELVFVVVLQPEGVSTELAVLLALLTVAVMLVTSVVVGGVALVCRLRIGRPQRPGA